MKQHTITYNRLNDTLASADAQALAKIIRDFWRAVDSGTPTVATRTIAAITHDIYFRRTNFANSRGREYIWIFDLAEAAVTLRDNAPDKIGEYLSAEEATHWLAKAQTAVDDAIGTFLRTSK